MIRNLLLFAILSIFSINGIYAQNKSAASINKQLNGLYSTQQKDVLLQMSKKFAEQFSREKAYAVKMAKEKGWDIIVDNDSVHMELMKVDNEGNPVYFFTDNVTAAKATRANTLHNGGILGLDVEGQGLTIRVWDQGVGRITHQEYDGIGGNNRYSIGDGATNLVDHSAHVMGTIICSGVNTYLKGMAPQAHGVGYDWTYDLSEATTAAANGMLISNHSYSSSGGFGNYSTESAQWDNVMYNAPYYLMIKSAGNSGYDAINSNPLDGDDDYDKLNGKCTSKNGLTVANGDRIEVDSDGKLTKFIINGSSSQGPTDDYRIKPDISGRGTNIYSSGAASDTDWPGMSGTSMAAPNVGGTLLLLQQHYNNVNGEFMRASTLKGLALHTADDAGIDYDEYVAPLGGVGPDAVTGWGLLNGMKAAQTITNNGGTSIISEKTLANSGSFSFQVSASGTEDLIVSISWTDPVGVINDGVNDQTPALVNDLDIRITRGGDTYFPYKLTGLTTNTQGDNIVDPFERVDVINPTAGALYTITVTHKGTLSSNQDYALIVTGILNETIASVTTDIPEDITENSATVGGNVITDGGHAITERGIVWGLTENPTISGGKLQIGSGLGIFTSSLTGLSSFTTYHVRAYATNSSGTVYGVDQQFTTTGVYVTPVADFIADYTSIDGGSSVTFTDMSENLPTVWAWTVTPSTGITYIGGTSSTSENPQIQFDDAGIYDITLHVSNPTGEDELTKASYITVEQGYPDASGGCSEFISNVDFGTISNATACDGYADYTGTSSTTVEQSSDYPIIITIQNSYSGNQVGCWIDWNMDGDFNDADETIAINYSHPTATATVSVPASAFIGSTRMRVRVQYNASFPNGTSSYGEVEDYAIEIIGNGTPIAPVANFTANSTSVNEGGNVTFTDNSTNTPTSWAWTVTPSTGVTYIGGTDSGSQNPQVQFVNAGDYTITLVATNAGGSDTEEKLSYITVNTSTDILMHTGSVTTCNGTFYDASHTSNYAPNTNYTLTINPETVGNNIKVSFTEFDIEPMSTGQVWDYLKIYDGPTISGTLIGTYYGINSPGIVIATNGSLTFEFYSDANTDGAGWVADVTCVAPELAPIADFTASSTNVCEGISITFTDESINTPTSWAWDFGDGSSIDNNQSPSHIYTVAGIYTVTLTATKAGVSDIEIKTDYITVNAEADAGTNGTLTVCAGTTPTNAQLFAELGGFPDVGGVWTNSGLVYTYTVTVTSPCTENATSTIIVTETSLPTVGFTIDNSLEPVIEFTNTSSNADSYSWNLGDGTILTTTDVSHEYTSSNTFTVVLSATNNCGTKTSQQDVVIYITNITGFTTESVKVFPNPAENVLHITLPVENVKIQLININGEMLKAVESKNTKNIDIDIEDIATGIYQLVITTENNEQITLKVVKM